MKIEEARERFDRAIGHCDAIMQVHKQHGGKKRGHRTLEPSLNRAVIVLAAGAWQTAVQDLTHSALDAMCPESTAQGVEKLLRAQVKKAIGDLNTPNSVNARNLMKLVDFDPHDSWTWKQRGGQGIGMVTISPHQAEEMTNAWMKLRHAVAHGHPQLPISDILGNVREAVRANRDKNPNRSKKDALQSLKNPKSGFVASLRLEDAKRCVAHVRRMTKLTANGLTKSVPMDAW